MVLMKIILPQKNCQKKAREGHKQKLYTIVRLTWAKAHGIEFFDLLPRP
jgi:hypothetical protein